MGMKESERTRKEADEYMDKSHEAEGAGFKDLARYYSDAAKALNDQADDLERQGK